MSRLSVLGQELRRSPPRARCLAVLVMVALCGCGTITELAPGAPQATLVRQHREALKHHVRENVFVPCVVKARVGNRMVGRERSILTRFNLTGAYSYPLKQILARAFDDALYGVFAPAKGDIGGSFTLELEVPRAQLELCGGVAEYTLECRARLRLPSDKVLLVENLDSAKRSAFDRVGTPEAVWEAAYDVAFNCACSIARDRRVHVAAAEYHWDTNGFVVRCDVYLYNLRGEQCAGSGRDYPSLGRLEDTVQSLTRTLVDDFVARVKPTTRPNIAVLDLANGDPQAKKSNLGCVFAGPLQTALHSDSRVSVVTRTDLRKILEEHDLQESDLVADPGLLDKRGIKISRVDYLVTGKVSVVSRGALSSP